MTHDILIVGAGHAGAQCAISLRQQGFSGSILVIGKEKDLPYERPPLSKEYFSGERSFERLLIRPATFWPEKNIEMMLGRTVTAVRVSDKRVTLDDGSEIGFGKLVWAAGGEPRQLSCPGSELEGIHYVRTRADCDRLLSDVSAGARRFVVIGGGYIGLEAAAVLLKSGCEIILVETEERILSRVAGPELSHFYEAEHRARGVDVRTGSSVTALLGSGRVERVELADGESVAVDAVIAGIGIVPSIQPLVAAGAAHHHGVIVDEYCRTSLPDIFAIGDCAAFACSFAGGQVMRVESVQNASDQATCVATMICGSPKPYQAFPWFWSNQYDLRLQTSGISSGYDETILRGDPEKRSFSVIYCKQGRVIALDCVNSVKDYVQGRKLVEAGAVVEASRLANPEVALKELLIEDLEASAANA